eukprot:gene55768-2568_t
MGISQDDVAAGAAGGAAAAVAVYESGHAAVSRQFVAATGGADAGLQLWGVTLQRDTGAADDAPSVLRVVDVRRRAVLAVLTHHAAAVADCCYAPPPTTGAARALLASASSS